VNENAFDQLDRHTLSQDPCVNHAVELGDAQAFDSWSGSGDAGRGFWSHWRWVGSTVAGF
jgi:hypothetical protein